MWTFFLAEPCLLLRDRVVAEHAYECLLPNADFFFQSGFAGMCTGAPVRQALGLLSLTLGRVDDAVLHLEGALAASESIGLYAELPRLRHDCALALLQRKNPGDAGRARGLLEKSRELLTELGQRGLYPLIDHQLAVCRRLDP
jgi:hypothetical protein